MSKRREFEAPNMSKKQPIYGFLRATLAALLFKKPKIINLAGKVEENAIVLANHSAKSGPPALDKYYPVKTAKWGAHPMLGTYKDRFNYLRNVLYSKKLGKKPGFFVTLKSLLMAFFSKWVYKGLRVIPTYMDARFVKTLRYSISVLEQGASVMIYPENSNEGYKDILTEFFPGFVMLSEKYYHKHGVSLPVYPVYYSLKKRIMVIGKPLYVQEFLKEGLNRYEIADRFCKEVNQLYYDYVQDPAEQEVEPDQN